MAADAALLIHGFTAGPCNLFALRDRLEADGVRCAVPALSGHGTCPEDMVGTSWADWQRDVRAAFDELRPGERRVAVVGHSMGGVLALDLTAERPDQVAGLAVLAPAVRVLNPLDGLTPALSRVARRWKPPGTLAYSGPEWAGRSRNYPWFDTTAYASFWAARRQVRRALPRVTAPLLVVHSRADRVVPTRAAIEVLAAAGSAHKEIAWFARSGHELIEDCESEAVCTRIAEFLSSL